MVTIIQTTGKHGKKCPKSFYILQHGKSLKIGNYVAGRSPPLCAALYVQKTMVKSKSTFTKKPMPPKLELKSWWMKAQSLLCALKISYDMSHQLQNEYHYTRTIWGVQWGLPWASSMLLFHIHAPQVRSFRRGVYCLHLPRLMNRYNLSVMPLH